MASSVFDDRADIPDDTRLEQVLGESVALWAAIKQNIATEYGIVTEEWKYYNARSGWLLKMLLKKRNLFFFVPQKDFFRISFIFGDKAVAMVGQSDLPAEIIRSLVDARKYMEGRGVSLEVRHRTDMEHAIELLRIKVEN